MLKKFRLQGKRLFLTYPQVPIEWTKEKVLDSVTSKLTSPVIEYVVGEELHLDGHKHYHVYIATSMKNDIESKDRLDIDGRHGNYQTVRNRVQCIQYCKKENNYITNIVEKQSREEKNKGLLQMALEFGPTKLLEEGHCSLKDYVWLNNGLNLYQSQVKKDEREDIPVELENTWNIDLKFNLEQKKCHFWIWSREPNKGKTTFLMNLKRKYRAEFWNVFESFQNQIRRDTEIIMLDEFRGNMKISMLNSLCDGTLLIPRKNLPAIELENKPLVVVCGNKSPEEIYKMDLMDYIYARFNIYII